MKLTTKVGLLSAATMALLAAAWLNTDLSSSSPSAGEAPTSAAPSPGVSPAQPASRPSLSSPPAPPETTDVDGEEAAALTAVARLTPEAENQRLATVLSASGPPRRDELERRGYDVMTGSVAAVKAANLGAEMIDYSCHAAGCVATLAFASRSDYDSAAPSLTHPSLFLDWPGGRIHPPPVEVNGRVHTRVILVRPDATAAF